MDNFLLHAITSELASTLTGLRLGKVYQLGTTDLALDFRLRDGRLLLVSTDPQRLALYLTTRTVRLLGNETRQDTAFPTLIKKYLSGARLEQIEKLGYDRVVRCDFSTEDERGQPVARSLVFSLIGRSANVFLLEGQRILAALRNSASDVQTPAANYHEPLPPADKLDPFQISAAVLDELSLEHAHDLAAAAQRHLLGFTALYAAELTERAKATAAHTALAELLAELFEQPPAPILYATAPLINLQRDPGRSDGALTLAPIQLKHLAAAHANSFPTINQAADVCFTLLDERRIFQAMRQQLHVQLSSKLKKQRTLVQNLHRERAGFSKGETHQRYGELLLANLRQAQKTADGFVVTDFYDEDLAPCTIPAANKATAQEAAEHYFKLARKARHGVQSLAQRLPQVERDVAELETRLAQLAALTQRAELEAFATQCGLRPPPPVKPVKAPQQKPKAKQEKVSGVRRYRSSDGYEIMVGRTDRDNDTLTFRVAKSFDLWFHVADYPGSHVLLRNPKRQPVPPRTITEAAQLAAKFSHARHDARVAVNYCERKFISKQKGFAPGQVRLSAFKTILVAPDEAGERLLE